MSITLDIRLQWAPLGKAWLWSPAGWSLVSWPPPDEPIPYLLTEDA